MTRNRSCTGKHRFPDRETAEARIWALVRKGTRIGRMDAYQCKHCRSWHVGHKARKRR